MKEWKSFVSASVLNSRGLSVEAKETNLTIKRKVVRSLRQFHVTLLAYKVTTQTNYEYKLLILYGVSLTINFYTI